MVAGVAASASASDGGLELMSWHLYQRHPPRPLQRYRRHRCQRRLTRQIEQQVVRVGDESAVAVAEFNINASRVRMPAFVSIPPPCLTHDADGPAPSPQSPLSIAASVSPDPRARSFKRRVAGRYRPPRLG